MGIAPARGVRKVKPELVLSDERRLGKEGRKEYSEWREQLEQRL